MTFRVTRSSGVMVQASEPTPSGLLNLSVIDSLAFNRVSVPGVHVYKHGRNAAEIIMKALSKLLVPYYPLAGRLQETCDGLLQVDCTGEGAWFVEASADCSLDSVNYLDLNILSVPMDDLVPTPPSGMDPIFQIQVTRFTCEGFVFGMKLHHCVCDGVGAAQILNTLGEFARGFPHPTIAPVWQRQDVPSPAWLLHVLHSLKANPPPLPTPPTPVDQLEHGSMDIPLDIINKLKNEFSEVSGGGYCSQFDIAVASLWRERTRAIGFQKDTKVNLMLAVNTRRYMEPPLPDGFYGNFFYALIVTSSSEWLVEATLPEIVKLIQDGKARVPTELANWLKNDELAEVEDPFATPPSYDTLFISEWGRLGFNDTDFGWGVPIYVLPIQNSIVFPLGIVGLLPTPKKGLRLMTWCVNTTHLPSLLHYYHRLRLSAPPTWNTKSKPPAARLKQNNMSKL